MGMWRWGTGNHGSETEKWAFVADFDRYAGNFKP